MPTLKIDKGEARDDGPWIRSEGHWGQLICHRVYLKHGLVSIAPNGPPDNYNYWSAMKVDWEGDPAEGSGPGRFSGTRDPIAEEIGRQWAAILDGQGGMVPKLGPIALDPVKVASEPYENTAYAKLIAADPPPKQPSPSVPVKYFSIYDGACLMVAPIQRRTMI